MCNTSDVRADDGFDPTRVTVTETSPAADDTLAADVVGAMTLLEVLNVDRAVLVKLTRHGRTEYVSSLGTQTTTDSFTMACSYPETLARDEIETGWRVDPRNPLANVTAVEYVDAPPASAARFKRLSEYGTKFSADLVRQAAPAGCGGCTTGCTGKCSV